MWGGGVFLEVISVPTTRGGGAVSQYSPSLRFPYIYAYTVCRRTAKFDVGRA